MGKKCAQAVGSLWTILCKAMSYTQTAASVHKHVYKKLVLHNQTSPVFPSQKPPTSICKNGTLSTLSTVPTITTILNKNNLIITIVAP